MKFKRPLETGDSGVRWLGTIPAHWSVVPSRRIFSERNEKAKEGEEQLTVSQKYGLISQVNFMEREGRRIVQVVKGHDILKHAETGDFVMSMRSFQGGLEYSGLTGSVSSAYVPLKPIKWVHPGYFRHLFKSSTYIQELQSTSDLVRDGQALRFENFSKVALPVVPMKEQAAIASYLDRATTRIDALVTKKIRFIELLREKRQALITRAVTKGLNARVPMKASGVKWLGDVPATWKLLSVKFLAHLGNGSTPAKDTAAYWIDGDFPWLTSTCVNQTVVRSAEQFVTATALTKCHLPIIEPPAVLVGITGQGRTRGMAATLQIRATINQHIVYLKPHSRSILTDHLRWFIEAAYNWLRLESEGTGSTKGAITIEQLAHLRIPLPPLHEQETILAYLNRATARIDTLVTKTERSIELLREHRTALITAAVTGKIDLRETAA